MFNIEVVHSGLWAPVNANNSLGRLIIFVRRAHNYGYTSKFKPNSEVKEKWHAIMEKFEFLLTILGRVSPF